MKPPFPKGVFTLKNSNSAAVAIRQYIHLSDCPLPQDFSTMNLAGLLPGISILPRRWSFWHEGKLGPAMSRIEEVRKDFNKRSENQPGSSRPVSDSRKKN